MEDKQQTNQKASRLLCFLKDIKISRLAKIGFVLIGIWMLLQYLLLESGGEDETHDIWLIDTPFENVDAYSTGEFIFYAFFIPAYVWGVMYIFRGKKRAMILCFVSFMLVSAGYIGYQKYTKHCEEELDKLAEEILAEMEAEKAAEQKKPIINRDFLGCSFGDSPSKCAKNVTKEVGKKLEFSSSNDKRYAYAHAKDICLGQHFYDEAKFTFYKDSLCKVVYIVECKNETSKLAMYKDFICFFDAKYTGGDIVSRVTKEEIFNNSLSYRDIHTKLKVGYSVTKFDGKEQFIAIVYIDRDGSYESDGL